MPPAVSSSKPSSSRPTASTSETAATRAISKPVTQAFRRPSRSMKMPGSTIASGSSRRISGDRTVSARMTMSGISENLLVRAHARVEKGVGEVDDDARGDDERRGEDHRPDHDGLVLLDDRLHRERSEARQAED